MSCCAKYDVCLIRGDVFTLEMRLAHGFDEVAIDPAGFEAVMAFRLEQNDALPDVLTLTVTPELDDGTVVLSFRADETQTQALQPFDIVHRVELRTSAGADTRRLLEGKVKVRD